MKTAIQGKDKILLFRLLKDEKTADAAKLALQTEHNWNYSRDTNITQTKDGAVVSAGGLETKLDIDAVSTRDEINKMLKESVIKGEKLEVWEIDLAGEKQEEKYPALYAQGNLESWELPSNVEDLETFSTSMSIDGVPVEGFATLTAAQEEEIAYAFRDTTKVAE